MKRLVSFFLVSLFCPNLFAQKIVCNDDPFLKRLIKERIVAAKHGNAEMQTIIGTCCLYGINVQQDPKLGLHYINLAEQSHYAYAYEVHGDYLSKSKSSLAKEKYGLAIQYYNPNDQFPVDTNILKNKIDYLPFGGFMQAAYDNFRKTEILFLSGDYESCSEIGDSILINKDKVSNIHDALSLSYSSLADREIMFSLSRDINNGLSIYRRHRTRETLKANKALDYFNGLEIDTELFLYNGQYSTILMKILQSTIECSKITNSNTYELLKTIHNELYPLLNGAPLKRHQQLIILYCEAYYQSQFADYNKVRSVIDKYINIVKTYTMEDLQERIEIVRQYSMFCDFINSIAYSNQEFIQCAVVNTLNKERLSRVIRSKQVSEMQWLEWNEISSSLPENDALMVYFISSNESDSWNYAWVIEKDCDYPQIVYAGHSYWSEEDAMDDFVKLRLEKYNNIWIVDNNRMRFTDYINDNRFHRIFSYKSGNNTSSVPSSITAIGDINYNISTRIILEEPLEESARELNYLFECFGDKLKVIQGEDFTKSSLLDCRSDILHISTHGKFDIELLKSLNCDNPSEGTNGNNIFRSCGIMLSGYNDDPKTNFLSAYDIMQMDLSHIDLVFLSACESASGKYLPEGNYSIAEAFHIAGVKQVIAFIDSVQENVASRFSEVFYEKVKNGHTYHNAFYETKLQVCPYIRIVYFE